MKFLSTDSELSATEVRQKRVKTCIFSWIGFWRISRYLFILGHMLLHKLYINVAIANNLLYRFTLQDLREPKYKKFEVQIRHQWKNGFQQISRYMFILGHMLLHKLYVNVVIADILVYSFTLQDLLQRKFTEKKHEKKQ